MPDRSRRKCPGPDAGIPCYGKGVGTPRGGRCAECRRARMNWQGRMRSARLKGLDQDKVEIRRLPSPKRYYQSKGVAEERENARNIEPDSFGIRGALKVIDVMQRVSS